MRYTKEDIKSAFAFAGRDNAPNELINEILKAFNNNDNIEIISLGRSYGKKMLDLAFAMLKSKSPEDILTSTGATSSSCNCTECQSMCHNCPCIGTPSEMLKIVTSGYENDVCITTLANPIVMTNFGKPITILAMRYDENKKHCSMLDNGLCKLHDKGLKPLEGKTALCSNQKTKVNYAVYLEICKEWDKLSINI